MIITVESKIPLKEDQITEIDNCLVVFSYHYRKAWYLFNNKQKPINEVRQFLSKTNELTSDQCDSIINKIKVDIAASIWLARQALFGVQYKKEVNVVYKKSFKEGIRFPFVMDLKQSIICKKVDPQKLKWSHVSFELGKNRVQWYQNFKSSILPSVVTPLFLDNFDPFSQSYLENSH